MKKTYKGFLRDYNVIILWEVNLQSKLACHKANTIHIYIRKILRIIRVKYKVAAVKYIYI